MEFTATNPGSTGTVPEVGERPDPPALFPWAGLARDPVARVAGIFLAVLSLPFFLPILSVEALTAYSEDYVDLIQFPMLIAVFGWGLDRIEHPERRRFTRLLMAALSLWWAVRLSYILFPDAPGTAVGDIAGDLAYTAFYFCVILAIECRPHLSAGWSSDDPTRHFRTLSVSVFLFTMLAYFVIIPSALNYAAYDTWLPSLYMYVALDLYIAARFFHACATDTRAAFCGVYRVLGFAALFWAAFDLLECLSWAGVVELSSGNVLDLLWWAPLPLLVAAARIPHVVAAGPDARPEARFGGGKPGTLRAVAPQMVVAFLIPCLHLAFYGAGLLDTQSRATRDLVVLASLVAFGVLLVLQQQVLERGNRSLQSALRQVNEQLEQSQKMEAIGRLAGGVAHDFNNLLTAILGHTRMLLRRLPAEDTSRADVEKIDSAGRRAASLTRQLLAFGRRQVLQPEVVDLNEVVADLREVLKTLVGDDVELIAGLDPDLGMVKADRGQLEQVIMNLCVNARDAMPDGGRLFLETRNEELPLQRSFTENADEPSGPQVVLIVRDDGCGMDAKTRSRAFEPFFTTKGQDNGTGLGLSTVYGIVRQSGGHVLLDSYPGIGTTFRIYLPQARDAAVQVRPKPSNETAPAAEPGPGRSLGARTVLLVEDEDTLRELTCEILEMYGYRVLTAEDGREALSVFEAHVADPEDPGIDLLLTDVVMPVMGGPELARRLADLQPGIPVLFVSGYTDEATFRDRELEPGTAFLGKPFTPDQLAETVGDLLERELRLQSS